MRFLDFYKRLSPAEKRDLARRLGTSKAYVSHIAYGHRRPGNAMTLAILRECPGVDPHPDSFGPERMDAA
jgi:hypothetical protein